MEILTKEEQLLLDQTSDLLLEKTTALIHELDYNVRRVADCMIAALRALDDVEQAANLLARKP